MNLAQLCVNKLFSWSKIKKILSRVLWHFLQQQFFSLFCQICFLANSNYYFNYVINIFKLEALFKLESSFYSQLDDMLLCFTGLSSAVDQLACSSTAIACITTTHDQICLVLCKLRSSSVTWPASAMVSS